MPQRGDKITLTIEAELVSDRKGGYMTMAYADCVTTVSDNGKELGTVSGRLGGSYEVHDNASGETWRIPASVVWYAFQEAMAASQKQIEAV